MFQWLILTAYLKEFSIMKTEINLDAYLKFDKDNKEHQKLDNFWTKFGNSGV